MSCVIVGGGLSGLSAAFFVRRRFPKIKITLLESSSRFGGWIDSIRHDDGAIHELGPRSVRFNSPTSPFMLHLVESIGLENKIIPIDIKSPAATRRFIYVEDKLHQLKMGSLRSETPFSSPLWLIGLKNLFSYHKENNNDLTVDEFFRSRFGDEVAAYLANPILRGIYAGDTKQLGIKAVFPQLLGYERNAPNFISGYALKTLSSYLKSESLPIETKLYQAAKNNNWVIWGLEGGMKSLPDALVEYLQKSNVTLINKCPVNRILSNSQSIKVLTENESYSTNCVILATPSFISAKLLNEPDLNFLKFVDVAVVILEYRGKVSPVTGFGHLIPSTEIPHVLGIVYDSCVFPQLDATDSCTTRFTCMIGGAWFHDYCQQMSNADFVSLAIKSIEKQLHVKEKPFRHTVAIHRDCIPQYGVKHDDLVKAVKSKYSFHKNGIALIGNSYDGVSVNDCVASAFNAIKDMNSL